MKGWITIAVALTSCIVGWTNDIGVSADRQTAPVRTPPSPCNGFPEEYQLPIDQSFYLGAHDATNPKRQARDITDLLYNGVRWIDLKLCHSPDMEQLTTCPGSVTLHEFADQVLDFARVEPEQVIIVHVSTPEDASIDKSFEDTWDQVCKVHAERTEGTDAFVKRECPFIYTHNKGDRWPSIGELVNYDPEMAQWQGDGELVGVRSRIILTAAPSLTKGTTYFSKPFWRSSTTQNAGKLKEHMHELCKTSGGIGLEAYADKQGDDISGETFDPVTWEEIIMSSAACNINETPRDSRLSLIQVDFFEQHMDYLLELQQRMIPMNYAKWKGKDYTVSPSKLVTLRRVKDEL